MIATVELDKDGKVGTIVWLKAGVHAKDRHDDSNASQSRHSPRTGEIMDAIQSLGSVPPMGIFDEREPYGFPSRARYKPSPLTKGSVLTTNCYSTAAN
jgi:hypothetical protein